MLNGKAVIVIDMLKDFINEDGALYCGVKQGFVTRVQNNVALMNEAGVPIIFVCDSHDKNDKEFDMFPPHCVTGTEGAEIIDVLKPYVVNGFVIPKTRYSGFYNTNLNNLLLDLGVHTLHLIGVCTDICVMHTCADAANRDYEVIVDENLVASFDTEAHGFALKHMYNILGAKQG